MPTLRDLLAPIISEAVNKAVDGYRQMLLGEDAHAQRAKPGPTPGRKKPGPKPKAVAAAAPRAHAAKKGGRRDAGEILQFVETVHSFIAEHPGLGAVKIQKKMGGDKLAISDALARLRKARRVVTTGERSRMTYVVAGGAAAHKPAKGSPAKKAAAAPVAAAPGALRKRKRRKGTRRSKAEIAANMKHLREFIKATPGLRSEEIFKALGGDVAGDLADALFRLRTEKKVKGKGHGRAMVYSV